jgi:hypothetical protein
MKPHTGVAMAAIVDIIFFIASLVSLSIDGVSSYVTNNTFLIGVSASKYTCAGDSSVLK